VSHLLNDLLMGIQGNISLIRLSLGPNHPSDPVLENTEELIHSGSFMINLLLGYLAERRFKTRQTRFRHLINETSGSPAHADVDSARRRFERWINTASKYDGLAHISRNCARIFKGLILNLRRCLDGMCAEAESSAVVKARFKKIYELADSVNRMAEKLLRFAGSQAPDLQSVSISCLLNERLDAFRQRHGHIRLKKYVSRSMTAIQADSMLIAEALDQILQNAAESMPTGGCLTARAKQLTFGQACNKHSGTDTGSYVMVEIADTGIGISPDAQDSIFDPFFTTKPHGKGHGLGLSAAVGALRIHGGFIEVESKPGSGSRFKLYLP
jgi:two-component system, cell cycle sensor histidine kinase and response regulator CckA